METAFYLLVAAVAILSAAGVVIARMAVHSALFLVATLFCLAVLFLTLGAEFLAVVQVLIYAGAIMVLFLFVITLLNPGREEGPERLRGQGVLAAILGLVLLVEGALVARFGGLVSLPTTPPSPTLGNTQQLALVLFSVYALPFELASVLLLAAIVGAIVLARGRL